MWPFQRLHAGLAEDPRVATVHVFRGAAPRKRRSAGFAKTTNQLILRDNNSGSTPGSSRQGSENSGSIRRRGRQLVPAGTPVTGPVSRPPALTAVSPTLAPRRVRAGVPGITTSGPTSTRNVATWATKLGEQLGVASGAERLPNGARMGAGRLPSLCIDLHRIALKWAPQPLGG